MARTQVITLPPGMMSNPYHRGKDKVGQTTLCETCDRVLNSRDWSAHQNSKGHRTKKQAEKDKENTKINNSNGSNHTDTWGGDASGFTPDAGFELGSPGSGNAGWGDSGSGGDFGTSSYGSKTGGGGNGGGQACFKCGEVGHRKADCPKGGSGGGGQACFNCGNEG
jgi:cellular nucleic acid-binding protein